MTTKTKAEYLTEMEQAKAQYEQYLEINQICQLPTFQSLPEPQYAPPSIENPLTTNQITLTKQHGKLV